MWSKGEARQFFRTQRAAMDENDCVRLSEQICNNILQADIWEKSQVIALYLAYGHEVRLDKLFEAAWGQGKVTLAPRCLPEEGEMEFVLHLPNGELRRNNYGILEPAVCSESSYAYQGTIDLILVPGLAFTPQGVRLGMGKGYYDRFFLSEQSAQAFRIGCAFDWQTPPEIPFDDWDIPMDMLCTESRCLLINR